MGLAMTNVASRYNFRPSAQTNVPKLESITAEVTPLVDGSIDIHELIVEMGKINQAALSDGRLVQIENPDDDISALLNDKVNGFWDKLGFQAEYDDSDKPEDNWGDAFNDLGLNTVLLELLKDVAKDGLVDGFELQTPLFKLKYLGEGEIAVHPVTWEYVNQGTPVWIPSISDRFLLAETAVRRGGGLSPSLDESKPRKKQRPNPMYLFVFAAALVAGHFAIRNSSDTNAVPDQPQLPVTPVPELQTPLTDESAIQSEVIGAQEEIIASPFPADDEDELALPPTEPSVEEEPIDLVIPLKELLNGLGKPVVENNTSQNQTFSVRNEKYSPEILTKIFQAVCSGGNVTIEGLDKPIIVFTGDDQYGMKLPDIKCKTGKLLQAETNFVFTVTQTSGVNIPGTVAQVPFISNLDLITQFHKNFESGGNGSLPSSGNSFGLSQLRLMLGGSDAVTQFAFAASVVEGKNGVKWPYPQVVKVGSEDNSFVFKAGTIKTIILFPSIKSPDEYLAQRTKYSQGIGIPINSPMAVTEMTAFRFLADKAMIEQFYFMQNK